MRGSLLVTVTLGVLAGAALAAAQDEPITVGIRTTIHSAVLGEDRDLQISTPTGYARSRGRYPVVYVLDGNAHFLQTVADTRFLAGQGLAPEIIVVAVATSVNRGRDLSPATKNEADLKDIPGGGGADRFRRFLVSELRPFIEGRYRTEPYRILIGWSLGGLFAIHTLLEQPDAFDACFAISPSLWWDNEAEVAKAERLWRSRVTSKNVLYLTHGREYNGIPRSVQSLTRVLGRTAPPGLRWEFEYLPKDGHSSSPFRAIYNGFDFLFQGWGLPEDTAIPSPAELERHYARLTEAFGFPCRPDEMRINAMAYALLGRKRIAEAIALFEYNARLYPESPNVYDSLADAQEADGRLDAALENCRKACRLAQEQSDSRIETLRMHLERVSRKVQER